MSEVKEVNIKSKEKRERRAKEKKEKKERESGVAEAPAEDVSEETTKPKNKRSDFSIWIGNLPYSITKEDLVEFFKPCNGTITRINLPKSKNGKTRGFAYVDFDTEDPMNMALAYSEQTLGGRAVLIKSASDFNKTGMPSRATGTPLSHADEAEKPAAKGKWTRNPPSPTLFLGNLSYDIKRADLKALFRPFGELVGVRVATFEDNPQKCKGFAYIDFKYTDDAAKAMKSPEARMIGGRKARIEFAGEDATRKGRPWEFDPITKNSYSTQQGVKREAGEDGRAYYGGSAHESKTRKLDTENMAETKLQGLPVAFEGQKITFGD
ncbi:Nucleolar protein 13 [Coemansia sp. RSA 1822]|nr:Nucleolar protein 13 [Coemansia sp. RSA 638]KAJ2126085.1 Nucleolar protein 13 [Coemansia sp. RSA 720]KAJ2541344.1 Nucleolar protein 13 [Coemansia sp. RSA 1853]KAJ2562485.1 Nucleolar protein 13 [Coemansia sp. RSA 1822]